LWTEVWNQIEQFQTKVDSERVTPRIDIQKMRELIKSIDLQHGMDAGKLIEFMIQSLQKYCVHNQSAANFGIHSNGVSQLSAITEAVIASFNPQLSTWIQSPFASELEGHLVESFGAKFGYRKGDLDGCFANNETEANQTAILLALTEKIPHFATKGLHHTDRQPIIYVSRQTHPSIAKAARMSGLGYNSIKVVPNDEDQFMDAAVLDSMIRDDLKKDALPFMVIGSGGSTLTGSVDPILEISAIAKHFKLWSHIDVGHGGCAFFLNNLNVLLEGIEFSDSISIDINKFLSQPSDSSMFITRHPYALENAFRCDEVYVPVDAFAKSSSDYFAKSAQWSRRFMGLKAFSSLSFLGWKGCEEIHHHQCRTADFLREKLIEANWEILNKSHLPVVCFTKPIFTVHDLNWICQDVISSGRAWLSVISMENDLYCLRASTTNFKTTELDVIDLVNTLEEAAEKIWLRQNRIPEV